MATANPITPFRTYTLAHTAKCKLNIAANKPDRNLRFVLGHAVLLDNVLLRIVEIENKSAKDIFEGKTQAQNKINSQNADYDCTASSPLKQSSTVDDNTKTTTDSNTKERRISFQDNNARPNFQSDTSGTKSPRTKSPPPPSSKSKTKGNRRDSDSASSDDYDFDDPSHNLVEDEYNDDLDEEDDEDDGLGLTRFTSATAQPPRQPTTAATAANPPPLSPSSGSSSDEDEDDDGPVSPPALPSDVDLTQIISGPEDTELSDLYNSVRRCPCHGHHKDEDAGYDESGQRGKMWSINQPDKGNKDGPRIAVMEMKQSPPTVQVTA